jgi:hypothetical protein
MSGGLHEETYWRVVPAGTGIHGTAVLQILELSHGYRSRSGWFLVFMFSLSLLGSTGACLRQNMCVDSFGG